VEVSVSGTDGVVRKHQQKVFFSDITINQGDRLPDGSIDWMTRLNAMLSNGAGVLAQYGLKVKQDSHVDERLFPWYTHTNRIRINPFGGGVTTGARNPTRLAEVAEHHTPDRHRSPAARYSSRDYSRSPARSPFYRDQRGASHSRSPARHAHFYSAELRSAPPSFKQMMEWFGMKGDRVCLACGATRA
jgi:hypothetical protein